MPAAAAPASVAIVEESPKATSPGQMFDLLPENTQIDLMSDETIVLGYLKSCMREKITGGKVTVGPKQSTVEGGKVTREKTECAVNKLALSAEESQQSATIAFRGGVKHIFTRQPIVIARKSDGVIIEAVEDGAEWRVEPVSGRIDFAAAGLDLKPGMTYRLKGFTQTVLVEVDPKATNANTGLLERVLILD